MVEICVLVLDFYIGTCHAYLEGRATLPPNASTGGG